MAVMTDPIACTNCGKRHRIITSAECADRTMTERTLQSRVVARAKRRGWKVAHAGKAFVGDPREQSGRFITPMSAGWPDLTLAKAGSKLIFMELKRQQGILEPEQIEWLRLLNLCGCRAIVIRPADLRSGAVQEILNTGSPI